MYKQTLLSASIVLALTSTAHAEEYALFDEVVVDLRAGESPLSKGSADDKGVMPEHGTLSRVRQQIPKSRCAGIKHPE